MTYKIKGRTLKIPWKREMMEPGKQQLQQEQRATERVETDSGSKTQMIAVSGVIAALALGYLIFKVIVNTSARHCCPPSSPPDGYEQQQVKVSQPVHTPHKTLVETTGVVLLAAME